MDIIDTHRHVISDDVHRFPCASRIAWGSNLPAAEQSLPELVALAKRVLDGLPQTQWQDIFAGTARRLYPDLAG